MFRRILILCLCLMVACGCERRREREMQAVAEEDYEYVVAVLVDLSGSFLDKMTEGGHAHEFLLSLIDRYFRERIGTNDQIIIAQISATPDRTCAVGRGRPSNCGRISRIPEPFAISCDRMRTHAAQTSTTPSRKPLNT